jgi:hypothetical protein
VIALCDEVNAKRCPFLPGTVGLLHWDFPERRKLRHDEAEQLAHYRHVRDMIKDRVTTSIAENP